MEDKISRLEDKLEAVSAVNTDLRQDIMLIRAQQENMHKDFQQLLAKLGEIHETIKPLSEWSAKSKGALAVIGTLVTLLFVVIGAAASAAFGRMFET